MSGHLAFAISRSRNVDALENMGLGVTETGRPVAHLRWSGTVYRPQRRVENKHVDDEF
jgi:hypothetical protein